MFTECHPYAVGVKVTTDTGEHLYYGRLVDTLSTSTGRYYGVFVYSREIANILYVPLKYLEFIADIPWSKCLSAEDHKFLSVRKITTFDQLTELHKLHTKNGDTEWQFRHIFAELDMF